MWIQILIFVAGWWIGWNTEPAIEQFKTGVNNLRLHYKTYDNQQQQSQLKEMIEDDRRKTKM